MIEKKINYEFMKVNIIIILTAVALQTAGQNLIPNSSFENGGELSCSYNYPNDYNIENWFFTIGSFDWFDWEWTSSYCPASSIIYPDPISSSRFTGIYGQCDNSQCHNGTLQNVNESIAVQLKHSIKTGTVCKFSARFFVTSIGNSPPSSPITLYLRFSTYLNWWKSNNYKYDPDKCIVNIPINISPQMFNQWIEVEKTIFLKPDNNNLIEDNFYLNYLIIQGSEDNEDSYIFIDDVTLNSFCDHYCLPEKFKNEIEFAPQNDSLYYSPSENERCKINGGYYQGEYIYPYYFIVLNAQEIIFRVFGRWGEEVFTSHTYNINGLETDGYEAYTFWWNGIDNNGNPLVYGLGNYEMFTYKISIKNCNPEYTYNYIGGRITVFGSDQPPSVYPNPQDLFNLNFDDDCCEDHKYFQKISFQNEYRIDVNDFIMAGENIITSQPTGLVIVEENSITTFKAGNQIILLPGFIVESGATFNAIIADCSDFTNKNLQLENNKDINNSTDEFHSILKNNNSESFTELMHFTIYPNPFSNSFTVSIAQPEQTDAKIYLTDAYGRQVLGIFSGSIDKGQHSIDVSTDGITKGLYFCVMETPAGRNVVKVIKTE